MRFMVDITFIPQHQSEIAALVPKEQAHIKTLMEQGIVQAIYISADRSHVCKQVLNGSLGAGGWNDASIAYLDAQKMSFSMALTFCPKTEDIQPELWYNCCWKKYLAFHGIYSQACFSKQGPL